MTYEAQALAFIQSAPTVEIPVGRFTLRFSLTVHRDWGWVWEHKTWLHAGNDYFESPEYFYLDDIYHEMNASEHDLEFIDELIEAMQKKPFNQGETV